MQIYPKARRVKRLPSARNRPWAVDYSDMIYDMGGSASWTGYHRTQIGAHVAAWWTQHITSWGGRVAVRARLTSDLTDEQRERVADAVAEALADVYACGRVWEAWSYGTMSEDDFSPAGEDPDILDNVIDAVYPVIATILREKQ